MADRISRMKTLINDLAGLERNLVSDGFDAALERLRRESPLQMDILEYPSGSEAWTWIIPDKWACHEAYLERMNGERLIDYRNDPLHCASYSSSFEGVVTRDELFEHLHTNSFFSDAIPWRFKYYRTDWGLCCSADLKKTLSDEEYKVVIRTEHTPGKLKVGEVVVKGETDAEIIICAHLCHPTMVNDDLSGVVVGMEVMRHLMTLPNLRYTYRLLLTPETIGSIAWLSSHEELIPKIQGGLFLEMVGTDCPHALQMSFTGDTEIDQCILSAVKEHDPDSWNDAFRRIIGNDERQFNAPGVRIPMLSLSRVFHPSSGKWPYPEYHTDKDRVELINWDRLDDSVELVLNIINRLEENRYPVNLFHGEVFATRYGLFVDFFTDQEGNWSLFDIIQRVDGSHTVNQIATTCGISFGSVMKTLKDLKQHELIRFSDTPVDTRIGRAAESTS